MADISMCGDEDCPSKQVCKRHPASGTVPHLTWQSWANFDRKGQDKCDSMLKLPKSRKKKQAVTKAAVTLELSNEQAAVIESALELYSRLHLGQFWIIQEIIFPEQFGYEKRDKLQKACRELYMPELQDNNCNHGIGSKAVNDSARTAWVVQKTLRYCRSWAGIKKHPKDGRDWSPEGQMGVNFDEPDTLMYSEKPPVCSYTINEFKVEWPWK